VDEILREIKRLPVYTPNVTITGGEPLLQKGELATLVRGLITQNYKVSLETNGSLSWMTIPIPCSIVMDIKPPSSGIKDFDNYREKALINASYLGSNDWLKLPIQDETDFLFAVSERRILLGLGKMQAKIAFSAVAPLTPKELLSWLFKENIGDAVLNIQIHKLINVS
jgi:7-carboxy-7-deazaguanine synthase